MLTTTAIRATGVLLAGSFVLAAAIVWLLLTDPVTVVTAVNQADAPALFDLLKRVVVQAFQVMVKFL